MIVRQENALDLEAPEIQIINIGNMEIWNSGTLARVRISMRRLADAGQARFGIDMQTVKHIPCGFFGLLYDYYDQDISVVLCQPQPIITNMLWFRTFLRPISDNHYEFYDDAAREPPTGSDE